MRRDEFLTWLYEYCEGNSVETRALLQEEKPKSTFHHLGDWESIDKFCHEYSYRNLYFGVCTRNGGGSREHVVEAPACWADLDFKNVPEEELKKTVYEFPLRPSLMVATGGGYHPYWRFREPLTQEDLNRLEAVNKQIERYFNGDPVSDAPRILRLPETINHKYDEKPEAKVIWQNDIDYTLEDFEDFFSDLAAAQRSASEPSKASSPIEKDTTLHTNSLSLYKGVSTPQDDPFHTTPQNSTAFHIDLGEGNRDNSLFHIANCCLKGGMDAVNTQYLLKFLAAKCDPPFPEKEAEEKIKSAIKRTRKRDLSISSMVREWVVSTEGHFLSTELYKDTQLSTPAERKAALEELRRLKLKGIIEKASDKRGHFRLVDKQCEDIDFLSAGEGEVEVRWPLDIDKLFKTMPGNIAVVAGEPDSGKTAYLLNIVKDNQYAHEIHYFSSEMGAMELRSRLELFPDIDINQWSFHAKERAANFQDVIRPDGFNIIDFLEIHDAFYTIGGMLKSIHDRLKDGVAVIAIQKGKGVELGRGGSFSVEKPRLYLSLSNDYPGHSIKIVKCKNWRTSENPNGLERRFKLVNGCQLIELNDWHRQ